MSGHEHPNVALVREGFEAMEKGDMSWMEERVADDVVWHVGGNSRMAGEYRGKEKVAEMFAAFTPETMSARIHDIVGNDEHVVVLGDATVTAPDGDSVTYRYVNVFHIRDGKTTEAWGMSENDAETDPIWDKLGS